MKAHRCVSIACITVAFSTGCWAETREVAAGNALSKDPETARAAVETLSKSKDAGALLEVMEKTRLHEVRILAIKELGNIKAEENANTLVDVLRSTNVAVVEGGSEQQAENRQIKKALVVALASICEMEIPKKEDADTISAFISECREKIQWMYDKQPGVDGKNPRN